MARRIRVSIFLALACILLNSCAHHPVDCALDLVSHDDCEPGTAGYDSMQKRAQLAAEQLEAMHLQDDATCKSYGLEFATTQYIQCRELMVQMRNEQYIAQQNNSQGAKNAAIAAYMANSKPQPLQPYVMPTHPTINCTTTGPYTNCR